MKKFFPPFFILIFLLGSASISVQAYHLSDSYTNLNGEEIYFDSYAGKLLFIEGFYTHCGYCQQLHPILESLHEDYGSQIQMVSLAIWPDKDDLLTIQQFTQEYFTNWDIGLDSDGSFANTFAIDGTPTSILFDEDGTSLYVWNGLKAYNDFSSVFDHYLQYFPDASNSVANSYPAFSDASESESSVIGDLFSNPVFKVVFWLSLAIMVYLKVISPAPKS